MNKKNNKSWIIYTASILVFLLILTFGISYAKKIESDIRIRQDSRAIYYLNVRYDGVDKDGLESSDSTVSEITSGVLQVENKIPEGLEFTGFVTTSNGSIGAYKNSDGSTCLGKIIDDTNTNSNSKGEWNSKRTEYTYHGLHYDATKRLVHFKIRNLKAGCILTVGIKTKTPRLSDLEENTENKRMDFYDYASAREKGLTVHSNLFHTYIGNSNAELYNVSYEYTGEVPKNAPNPPETASYIAGQTVGTAREIKVGGYKFLGWESTSVSIIDDKFMMPTNDVVLKGSFQKQNTNKVKYKIDGDIPEDYVIPFEKEYAPETIVKIDRLKKGTIISGYRFLGWNVKGQSVNEENEFIMPSKNVEVVGQFEEIKYKVEYQFYKENAPKNSSKYLPKTKYYKPGERVKLENVIEEPKGYKFLGWLKEQSFIMPDNNVIIYGQWDYSSGEMKTTITKEIISKKKYYRIGDEVLLKINIKNEELYSLYNISIKEDNKNAYIIEGKGYNILSEHIATIDRLDSNSSINIYARYIVDKSDKGKIKCNTQIISASSENQSKLPENKPMASVTIKIQPSITICNKIDGKYQDNTIQYQLLGKNKFESWLIIPKNGCEKVYVDPSKYQIHEIVPQDYEIKRIEGTVDEDEKYFEVKFGKEYKITYTNEFIKKSFYHAVGKEINRVIQEEVVE